MSLPLLLVLFFIYCYSLLILLFYMEIEKEPVEEGEKVADPLPLSVIVPLRNERDLLPGLFRDLQNQTCPGELWELIFVDDHSVDGTVTELEALLRSSTREDRDIYCFSLPAGRSGKKAAIAHGIARAKYERILQVDGDCSLGPGFIASHIKFQQYHPSDLTAGLVSTWEGRGNFLETFERLDLLALMGSAAGSFGAGRPLMCSGANLSYSKELYRDTRSFDPEHKTPSGDDMFLMIGARKLGRSLAFNTDREALVLTRPVKNLRSLLAQRIRWGSKSYWYRMSDIQLLALLVSLTNIAVFLMPLWMILYTGWWPWLAVALLIKTLADFLLLYRITGISGQRADLRLFIPVTLLYYPFFLASVMGALRGKARWKRASK